MYDSRERSLHLSLSNDSPSLTMSGCDSVRMGGAVGFRRSLSLSSWWSGREWRKEMRESKGESGRRKERDEDRWYVIRKVEGGFGRGGSTGRWEEREGVLITKRVESFNADAAFSNSEVVCLISSSSLSGFSFCELWTELFKESAMKLLQKNNNTTQHNTTQKISFLC